MKTIVPAIPIEYHIYPYCIITGIIQNTYATPLIKNKIKISGLPIYSTLLIVSINLLIYNIPAIKVAATVVNNNIVNISIIFQLNK